MTALIPDRWRSTVRAPVRAADRAARLAGVRPRLGPAYTRKWLVVAFWARRWEHALTVADKKARGIWLP